MGMALIHDEMIHDYDDQRSHVLFELLIQTQLAHKRLTTSINSVICFCLMMTMMMTIAIGTVDKHHQ